MALVAVIAIAALTRVEVRSAGFAIAVVVGGVIGLVVALTFMVWRRDALAERQTRSRRIPGRTVFVSYLLWLGLLAWTLPRFGPSHLHAPLGAGTVAFGATTALACTAFLVRTALARPATAAANRAHRTADCVAIWHVHGDPVDYFVARCDCGWAGRTFDSDAAQPLESARADARRHGTNVASMVVDIET